MTWVEDRATLASDPSAVPGAEAGGGGRRAAPFPRRPLSSLGM